LLNTEDIIHRIHKKVKGFGRGNLPEGSYSPASGKFEVVNQEKYDILVKIFAA